MYSPSTGCGVSVVTIRWTIGFGFERFLEAVDLVPSDVAETVKEGSSCAGPSVEGLGEVGSGVLLASLMEVVDNDASARL